MHACQKRRLPIQLVAFTKVLLQPEESKGVDLRVELRDLAAYDAKASKSGQWQLERGIYQIFAGSAASADLLQQAELEIEDQAFSYPGRVARSSGPTQACEACVPEVELIQGASLPGRLPVDPFIVFVFAVVYRIPLSVAAACLLVCICWRCCGCCCRKTDKVDDKKES
ncbi:bglB [Symbiodinium natans]|uniref:BglB protein n=1 Tax=Symbiodinium natans TaxID=878477 RepID=A0A812NTI6_9DINO|nr:bglB [Symbiodinium natans]